MTAARKEEILDIVRPRGQEQLLRFWDELNSEGRQRLAGQIKRLDWDALDACVQDGLLAATTETRPADIEPAAYFPVVPEETGQQALYRDAREAGRELLAGGAVAGFTVAGGQGTRLGYDAPKGTFPISPVTGKSLFQIFAESILRTREKYGTTIPWYIMTSPINDAATRKFFVDNRYFGLVPENIAFFPQGTMPAVDQQGSVLLADRDSLALSPNGHGGSLLALRDEGALDDMAARGIEHISYWQVDNPLVQMFDPLFLGLHKLHESDMSSRSLTKTGPFEKLGNFCIVDGKLVIIEYSDMPEELAAAVDANGRLRFRAGSPAIHILRRRFVERLTRGGLHLPFHRAHKKVPFVNDAGARIEPIEPNAYKFEMFIFDALPLAEHTLILEANREEHFAPVKNLTGVDSVESSRAMSIRRAARWLSAAGIPVPVNDDGMPTCRIELSPRRFLDAQDVLAAADKLRPPEAEHQEYYE